MEKALWYLIAGTRGGENRARIIRLLNERPRNANQLATRLDVGYNTVRHHLEILEDHDVVETGGRSYGELYFLTDRFTRHWEAFESITERLSDESTASESDPDSGSESKTGTDRDREPEHT